MGFETRRALFIGPNDGRRVLKGTCPRWQTDVAPDVDHGLLTLEVSHAEIDAVVIDERLGVLIGHALLAHIQGMYPHLSCLLLREKTVAPTATSPLFLPLVVPVSAPPEQFEDRLGRTCALQRLLTDEGVRAVCGELNWLPPAPRSYWALAEALSSHNAALSGIADIIQSDPVISAKILQLVNRAFFGLSKKTSSIQHAVTFLGTDILRGLVLTAHVFSAIEGLAVPGFSLEEFQDHSVRVAHLARRFVRSQSLAEEAFTAGLVHDIGMVVLALRRPAELSEVLRRAKETGEPVHMVEREVLGITHAEAGAYLLSAWGLPTSILECAAFHHTPDQVESSDCELLAVVHGADALINALPLDEPLLKRTGFSKSVTKWLEIIYADQGGVHSHAD